MKALKKYAYMSPETEIQSLETGIILLVSGNEDPNQEEPGNATGYGAPWRF